MSKEVSKDTLIMNVSLHVISVVVDSFTAVGVKCC